MQENEQEGLWQVTCVCGWRTHGRKSVVVEAVMEHGRAVHGQELTEQQVFDQAVRYPEA